MSEEVLATIGVHRTTHMGHVTIFETLFFTPYRTVVARKSSWKGGTLFGAIGGAIEATLQQREDKKKGEQYSMLSLEDIIKADKNNYAIPNSEITEVELQKYVRVTKINIKTGKKYGETKWLAEGLWKDVGEKYENMLRPIFKDNLIVKK
jgi:hypothetical protein